MKPYFNPWKANQKMKKNNFYWKIRKYVCLDFNGNDCELLNSQSVFWFKFTGQAGTKLPTCNQVDSYTISNRNFQNYLVICIKGQHPLHSSEVLLTRKRIYNDYSYNDYSYIAYTAYPTNSMSVKKYGDEYIYGIPALSCSLAQHIKIMGI